MQFMIRNRLTSQAGHSSRFSITIFATLAVVASIWFSAPPGRAQTAPQSNPQGATQAQVEAILKASQQTHGFSSVAISPDGQLLAYAQPTANGSRISVAAMSDPAKTISVSASKENAAHCGEGRVAWSPDSKHLAFLGDCAPDAHGQNDVFVATVRGEIVKGKAKVEVAQASTANGEVGYPSYSPDGRSIAFLYVAGATRNAGALAAMKPWSGVIGEDGIEVQRIARIDADPHKPMAPQFLTPANLHVYEFDWAPDSHQLAYVAAAPPGENNWWVANLYTQSLDAAPTVVFAPTQTTGALHNLQIAVPRWSPDGKAIAFIGGLMSDQGSTGGDVWLIPASGATGATAEHDAVDLTPSRATSPAWMTWADNTHLYVSELAGGNSQLVELTIPRDGNGPTGTTEFHSPVFSLPGSVADGRLHLSLSTTRDHATFVFTASSFDHPPEVYAAHTTTPMAAGFSGLTQLTHANDSASSATGELWGKTTSLSWTSDGFNVQGWLHFPKGYDPAQPGAKKYALIVLVHGGPAAAAMSRWGAGGSLNAASFSALGYFVLEPNPRGSYGQGEAFAAANRKDFGYGDLRDILAGVDSVLANYPVDANRVGLTGWSYGGFMTMFAVTQTNRFKAAVAGAGIANWQSYYGENSIDQWMTPYFGASVYQDPAVYAKSSAISFIDRVRTPVLVVVGDRDGECPAPQSFEFWHALRDQHVPTQLVVYPNEGHGFVNPEHRTDVLVRAVAWFEKYMPPQP